MINSKISKTLILLYFLVSIVEIIGIVLEQRILLLIFKPLIIPILGLTYINSVDKINKWYLLVLVLSFLGDVFLLFSGSNYFILGLGSFLLAHIVYIKIVKKDLKLFTLKKIIVAAFPFVLIFIFLISILYQNLGGMLAPVIIYGLTISVFGAISFYNYLEKKSNVSLLLALGAVIFIASDAMIALQKFHEPKSLYPVAIMITYVLAQYLIFKYMIGQIPQKFKANSQQSIT